MFVLAYSYVIENLRKPSCYFWIRANDPYNYAAVKVIPYC